MFEIALCAASSSLMNALKKNGADFYGALWVLPLKKIVLNIRNSRTIDVVEELQIFGVSDNVYDPVVDCNEVKNTYGIDLVDLKDVENIQAAIAAVPVTSILNTNVKTLARKGNQGMPFIDVKSMFFRKELGNAKLSGRL